MERYEDENISAEQLDEMTFNCRTGSGSDLAVSVPLNQRVVGRWNIISKAQGSI